MCGWCNGYVEDKRIGKQISNNPDNASDIFGL